MQMRFSHAGASDVGRKRTHNEDAFLLLPEESLYCVADGMGGHASGEVASKIAVEEMAEFFRMTGRDEDATWPFKLDPKRSYDENRLVTGVKLANLRIHERARTDEKLHGMGTTIVAAAIPREGNAALVGHVGDSRAYLFRRGELVQLTTDQTLVHEMIAAGSLTPEQARVHPQRNMITQALGCPTPIVPVLGKAPLRRGDRLLICSDGLHGEVEDGRLKEILAQAYSPRRTLELMLEEALRNGGRDNITALLLALDDPALRLPAQGEVPKVTDPDNPNADGKASLLGRLGRVLGSR